MLRKKSFDLIENTLTTFTPRVITLGADEIMASVNESQELGETYNKLTSADIFTPTVSNWIIIGKIILQEMINIYNHIYKIITQAKSGIIDDYFLSTNQLLSLKAAIEYKKPSSVLPISFAAYATNPNKLEIFRYKYTIIIRIIWVLFQHQQYDLYYLHPLPLPQKNTTIAPREKYLAIDPITKHHIFLENLENCAIASTTTYCPPPSKIHIAPTCESRLKLDPITNLSSCAFATKRKHEPIFQILQQRDGWIYSLPKPENITIKCNQDPHYTTTIRGLGLLKLEPDCHAYTSWTILTSQFVNFSRNYNSNSSQQPHLTIKNLPEELKILKIETNFLTYLIYFLIIIGTLGFSITYILMFIQMLQQPEDHDEGHRYLPPPPPYITDNIQPTLPQYNNVPMDVSTSIAV